MASCGSRALFLAGMTLLGAAAAAPVARADATPTEAQLNEARTSFHAAVEAQDAGRYRDALALYAVVHAVAISAPLLFNEATCHERLGEIAVALDGFEAAVAEAHARGDAEVEEEARARVVALTPEVPRLIFRLAPGTEAATITLDGAPREPSTALALRVNPGDHRLVVRSPRHTRVFERTFTIAAREERTFDVDLGPLVVTPPPARAGDAPPPPARPLRYLPAIVAGSAALVFGGVAVGTGIGGHDKYEQFTRLNATPSADNADERSELRRSGQALYVANAVFIGVAVVAAGAAVYLALQPPKTR